MPSPGGSEEQRSGCVPVPWYPHSLSAEAGKGWRHWSVERKNVGITIEKDAGWQRMGSSGESDHSGDRSKSVVVQHRGYPDKHNARNSMGLISVGPECPGVVRGAPVIDIADEEDVRRGTGVNLHQYEAETVNHHVHPGWH